MKTKRDKFVDIYNRYMAMDDKTSEMFLNHCNSFVGKKNNIEQRKQKFKKQLFDLYIDKYKKEMLNEFSDYWLEHGLNDKKMRFEKEKSFGLSRRLSTWHKQPYNKHKNETKQTTKTILKNL